VSPPGRAGSFNPNVDIRTLYFCCCQELVIALQQTEDPGGLSCLRPHLDVLAALIQMLRFEPSMFFVLPGAGDCAAADRQPWRAELPASPPGRAGSLNPNVEIRTLHVFCFARSW
jgi:hypothetical protein